MSSRTPILSGIATPPANPTALGEHSYWGVYAIAAALPNGGANALTAPAFAHLQAGDIAYVGAFPGPDAAGALYVCQFPGTVGGNDADWVSLGGNFATVRDAHFFVVAENDGGGVDPYDATVTDADFIDTGNGAGIQSALAAAAVIIAAPGGGPVDIRCRPMGVTYDGVAVTGPLTIPAGCALLGANRTICSVTGLSGAGQNQSIFTMDEFTTLEGFNVMSPAPAGGAPVGGVGVIACSAGTEFQNIRNIRLETSGNAGAGIARVVNIGIAGLAADGIVVEGCSFKGYKAADNNTGGTYKHVAFANTATPDQTNVVRDCMMNTCDIGVTANCPRVRVDDCQFYDVRYLGVELNTAGGAGLGADWAVDGCIVELDTSEASDAGAGVLSRKACVAISSIGAGPYVSDAKVCNNILRALDNATPTIDWYGVFIDADNPGSVTDRTNVSNNNIRLSGLGNPGAGPFPLLRHGVTCNDADVTNTVVVANGMAGINAAQFVDGLGAATAINAHNV
jgi:hypothetical protein